MKHHLVVVTCLVLCLASDLIHAKIKRSSAARAAFAKAVACPATGLAKTPCPGYIIDHIIPLCAGGDDAPANMQWQTVTDAKIKDQSERRECQVIRMKK